MNLLIKMPALRRIAWRYGRKLYAMARGEGRNDPRINGEYWLLEKVISQAGSTAVLMDVGANKGNWSLYAIRHARPGQSLAIYAFEPAAATRQLLIDNCSGISGVSIHSEALSDGAGTGRFYSTEAGGGTSSLNPISGTKSEQVPLSTCDIFLRQNAIENVAMLKIDTEGFDFLVIKGAIDSLENGSIDVVQFEYNWRWLLNHCSLRDVFLLISGKPYRIGKLIGSSIEFYQSWHFELDRFFENNYVLVRRGSPYEKLGSAVSFDNSNSPKRQSQLNSSQ